MAKYQDTQTDKTSQRPPLWQRILQMPSQTVLKDISTGERYRVDQLIPVYCDHYQERVNDFRIKGSEETLCVSFLRAMEDKFKCSL